MTPADQHPSDHALDEAASGWEELRRQHVLGECRDRGTSRRAWGTARLREGHARSHRAPRADSVNILTDIGVDYGQGYFLGHPEPLAEHLAAHAPALGIGR
jgi:hypothetical protein